MTQTNVIPLILLALSFTNCTSKKTQPSADNQKTDLFIKSKVISEVVEQTKNKRKRTHPLKPSAKVERLQDKKNNKRAESNKSSLKGSIAHLLPNFTTESTYDFKTKAFFPLVKIFSERNIKLIVKPGDNQSLARQNRQQLAHVETLAFNLRQLND